MASQQNLLERFDAAHIGLSKGALSFALIVTRNMMGRRFPVDLDEFKTENEGQVAGLGGGAVKRILKDHGIVRVLSSEGGRTSRGNMGRLRAYLDILNDLAARGELDLQAAERFWIDRVNLYFDARPFSFKLESAKSIRYSFRQLIAQAYARQREGSGTMYAGAVMQHLVGAKLAWVFGETVQHHSASTADAPSNRSGDFQIGDMAIHVTTAPTPALIDKCRANLDADLRPLIITTTDGLGGAKASAADKGLEDRIDVIEFEQFMSANLFERGGLGRDQRRATIADLIARYNDIVGRIETDPSLRIEFDA